jgi:hypothetical protein
MLVKGNGWIAGEAFEEVRHAVGHDIEIDASLVGEILRLNGGFDALFDADGSAAMILD